MKLVLTAAEQERVLMGYVSNQLGIPCNAIEEQFTDATFYWKPTGTEPQKTWRRFVPFWGRS